jgi:hypothetical protein
MRACSLRLALAAAVASLLAPAPLSAQTAEGCRTGEPVQRCYQRLVLQRTESTPAPALAGAVQASERNDLQGKAAGPDVSAAEAASAIRDFLPRFAANLILPGPGDALSAIGLKTNVPVILNDDILSSWGLTGQLGAVVHQAEPFATLVDSIPEGIRESSRSRLRNEMQVYDDVSLTGALNVESARMGRSFRSHQQTVQRLTNALFAFSDSTVERERQAARAAYRAFVRRLSAADLDPVQDGTPACTFNEAAKADLPFECLNTASQAVMDMIVRRAAQAEAVWRQEAQRRMSSTGYNRISELVNNQPQLNGTFEYRVRSDVAGPDEWTGRVRFEMGIANMNGLRRYCARNGSQITLDCLQSYTRSEGVQGALSRGGRIWTEVAANHRPAYRVSLPDDSAALALSSATSFSLSGGYGAYFGNAEDGASRDRFDLQGKYDLTRDALRQDRAVVTAFYTRHLTGRSSAVLGLTWASKPEFVGEVDRKLGANVGVTYKLHSPDKPGS